MSALRRISTRRLLAICAVTVAAAIGVTAVAMAMGGGGPKPPPKPLANAVHDALDRAAGCPASAPGSSSPTTSSMHPASRASDPLLSGATGRLWASPDEGGKLRLELQSELAAAATPRCWSTATVRVYDGGSETVYEGTLPEEGRTARDAGTGTSVPRLGEIETRSPKPKSTPC